MATSNIYMINKLVFICLQSALLSLDLLNQKNMQPPHRKARVKHATLLLCGDSATKSLCIIIGVFFCSVSVSCSLEIYVYI